VWAVLGLLGAALAGVIITGDRVGARVVRALPAGDAAVGAFQRVGIEFAQPMQAASVEAHFSVEPARPGALRWEGRQLWFTPQAAFAPGTEFTVRLRAGALSQGGQAVKRDLAWTFRVREPWITYVSPPGQPHELWRVPGAGGRAEQVTDTGGTLHDYAVSRDGTLIVYSDQNEDLGIDLWIMPAEGGAAQLLVDCGLDRCTVPTWSPDNSRVAYSRENTGFAPGAPHGPPRVWTVDLASAQTTQLYQDSQVLGYGPSFSPDGRRLAFFDGSVSGIRVLDLQTSAEMVLPSWMGIVGTWSADGTQMLFNDLAVAAERPYARILIADFASQTVLPALGEGNTQADYSIPAWSPDGQWLVVSLRLGQQTPNEQLWIMRPDGSEARQITFDLRFTYGRYQWDPSGERVVFQRLALEAPYPEPELLVWSAADGSVRPIAQNATWPAWVP
jgi:TolB protein